MGLKIEYSDDGTVSQTYPQNTMKMNLSKMAASAVLVFTLGSCAGGPNAQTGAVLGGLGGAAVGGIIGNQSGRGLEGAAIGGALGALGGAAVGDARDKRNAGNNGQPQNRQQPPPYYGQPQPQPYYRY